MRFRIVLMLLLVLAVVAMPACAKPAPGPTPTPTPTPQTHPEVLIYHLDLPMGIGQTELHLGRDDLLSKTHPWLRTKTQETQGAIYDYKVMVDEPDRRKNTIWCADDATMFILLPNKMAPFTDGFKGLKPRRLYAAAAWTWTLQTEDPKIQTLKDLAGKRLASGAKAGTMNWVVEQILTDAGIHDKVNWSHMTFADIASSLLGKTVDAGFVGFYSMPGNKDIILHPPFVELQASGRPFHLVDWGKEIKYTVDRMGAPAYFTIPPNTLPGNIQPKDWMVLAMTGGQGCDATFPEDIAYELVKWTIANVNKFGDYQALGKLMTKESLCTGVPRNLLHPGALRAYEEAGLGKLLGPDVKLPEER